MAPLPADEPSTNTPAANSRRIANRLKRAQGQLAAVIAAVESGADCRNIVTQLSAVSGALDKAGFEIISTAMQDCLTPGASAAPGRAPLSLEELRKLFLSLT